VDASMLASHAALLGLTGRPEMSVFQTLSAGNMGQLGAPGTGVPADAVVGEMATVSPSHMIPTATNTTGPAVQHRRTSVPSLLGRRYPIQRAVRDDLCTTGCRAKG
jgi:hypothetical protein